MIRERSRTTWTEGNKSDARTWRVGVRCELWTTRTPAVVTTVPHRKHAFNTPAHAVVFSGLVDGCQTAIWLARAARWQGGVGGGGRGCACLRVYQGVCLQNTHRPSPLLSCRWLVSLITILCLLSYWDIEVWGGEMEVRRNLPALFWWISALCPRMLSWHQNIPGVDLRIPPSRGVRAGSHSIT